MRAGAFTPDDAGRWDDLVARSPMGTFLHSRRFLSHHGTRFEDRSVLLLDDDERLVGVLPAAVDPGDDARVVSHPGATYGGLVFDDRGSGLEVARAMLVAASRLLREQGHERLLYKVVPPHLQARPCQQDLYALWRQGARLVRRDLWNVLDLRGRDGVRPARARAVRQARRSEVTAGRDDSDEAYATFSAMLDRRLRERHGVTPVHDVAEMLRIRDLLAPSVQLWLARDRSGACLTGAWLFEFAPVALHGQYQASTADGRALRASDLLFSEIIAAARAKGTSWFSWGRSTEGDGDVLNDGLFLYKAAFGAGSVAHDFYELDLTAAANG